MSAPSPVRIWWYNPTGTRSYRDICPRLRNLPWSQNRGCRRPGSSASYRRSAHSRQDIVEINHAALEGALRWLDVEHATGLEGKRSPANIGCMSTRVVGNRTERLWKNGVRSDCRARIDASVDDSKNGSKGEKASEHSH